MSFLSPMALWWLAVALPIIGFYILKIRHRRVPVSTLLFWDKVFHERQPRSIFQKLRHPLSLLLQLLVLLLLALAIADPLLSGEAFKPRRIVLILDTSASMQATDVTPSRMEAAQSAVLRLVQGLREFDMMAIVTAGAEPGVACGLTGHHRLLREAVQNVRASDAPTRIDEAVRLAQRLLTQERDPQIIVLTDGALPATPVVSGSTATAIPSTTVAPPAVQYLLIRGDDKKADNLGITAFQVRRSLADPIGYEVLVEAKNFGAERAACKLDLTLGEDLIDVFPLHLEPGAMWRRIIEKTGAGGGQLRARLDHADALRVDNTAWAVLPPRAAQPVTLVTPGAGNVFVQKVFQAIPLVNLSIAKEAPAAPTASVTVFYRDVPAQIPPGPVLVIDPQQPSDLWSDDGPLVDPVIARQDSPSPLMAHVRLDNVYMPEARKLTPKGDATVLAATIRSEPVYFAIHRPEGRVLVLTANLDRGDLPLRTAFPILMSNALTWFENAGGELNVAAKTGDSVSVPLQTTASATPEIPGSPAAPTLSDPVGTAQPVAVHDGRAVLGTLDRCGMWTLKHGQRVTEIPCNLVNARESDLRPDKDLNDQSAALLRTGGRPVWFYLLAGVLLLSVCEWFLYQRRWIS